MARLAESTYEMLDEEQRRIARGLFLRLSSGEGDSVVRRRVPLAEIDAVENERVAKVVRVLTDARVLTVGEGTIEVAHEALLREWPRLATWIEEDREGRRLREHLATSAREWQARARDPAELYRGARLTSAIDWTTGHTFELTETERTFISESRQLAVAETDRQRRTNRRLRALLALAALALVIAVGAGAVAFLQGRDAAHTALVADAQRLGAQGLTESNLDLALLLGRQGVAFDDDTVTRSNLLSAIVRSPAAIGARRPVPGRPQGVNVSPDGRFLVVWNNSEKAYILDASTGNPVRDSIAGVFGSFEPDGKVWIANQLGPGQGLEVDEMSADHTTVTKKIGIPAGQNWFVAPDLSTYSVVDPDRHGITVTDSTTRAVVRHIAPANTTILDVYQYGEQDLLAVDHVGLIDPSDDQALNDAYNGPLQLDYWPAGAATATASITAPGDENFSVDPAHGQIAIAETHDTIGIYELASGTRRDFTLRHNNLNGFTWSPDGQLLVSAGDDKLLDVWNASTGEQVETLAGYNGRVFAPALSQVGGHTTAWSVGLDGQLTEWDLSGDRRIDRPFSVAPAAQADDGGVVMDIAVSANASMLATAGTASTVNVLDTHSLTTVEKLQLSGNEKPFAVAFAPDTKTLVVGGEGGALIQRFDTSTWTALGDPLAGFSATVAPSSQAPPDTPQAQNNVRSIAYSPDGKVIAAGSEDGTVRLWDASTGAPTGVTIDAGGPVWHVAFSPDGSRIAATYVSDAGGNAGVWNINDGQQLYTVSVDDDYGAPWTAVFSHDGNTLATGGGIGYVRFWDANTGQQTGPPILADAGWVDSLQYTSDDRELLAAGTDGTVRLLDPIGRGQLGSALPGGNSDSIATIGPDGRVFAVYEDDGHGYVWDVSLDSMESFACSVPGRTLTTDEWQRYLPNRSYQPACANSAAPAAAGTVASPGR